MSASKKFKAMPSIERLRLEAIFHPKFENETPDSEVRRKMLERVSAGEGYLEVSLKHSGSLLLWSGRQCFYSKNSTNNSFTRVGEIVLMKHFARCYGDGAWREEYGRCSEFVYKNRLTCSFEVVTSILGDHGDIPKRDYLILIAVADRSSGRGRFYSTNELVKFAHRFRLPHNDAWVLSSNEACEKFFRSYDDMRETGMATTVISRLDEIVLEHEGENCAKVASLCPHDVFQGEILEGLVARYVPHDVPSEGANCGQNDFDGMKELSAASQNLVELVPPKMGNTQSELPREGIDGETIEQVDLRRLAELDDFDEKLEAVLRSFHGSNHRRVQYWNEASNADDSGSEAVKCINVQNVVNEILSSLPPGRSQHDQETLMIAQLIKTLDQLKIRVSYKVFIEQVPAESKERCICILHIHNDSSFPKYNGHLRREGSGGMMLFRGFSIELVPTGVYDASADCGQKITNAAHGSPLDIDDEKLMLKMKFLPYMVRTFICRNGLSIIQRSGISAFENHALTQLTKWGMSDDSVRKWMPFFKGWAKYCLPPQKDANLPPLTEKNYLLHYNNYSELFTRGQFQSGPKTGPSFHGLLVIVGQSKNNLGALSSAVSRELNCAKVVDNVNRISEKDILLSMQRSGGGLVCIAEIEDGISNLRKLAKQNQDAINIIMVEGCDEVIGADSSYLRKIKGMTQAWKKTKCNMMLDIPKESAMTTDLDAAIELLRTDETAKDLMRKLKDFSKENESDDRPGVIIYFPSIPGSGKSTLCESLTADSLGIGSDRKLALIRGDEVKGKFYNVAAKEILAQSSCVAILDKNVPPISFASIHELCLESKSIAIYLLFAGMGDTWVGVETSSQVYPFTLHFLAACMSRVLNREPETHAGKLDASTENVCMVVVKFYTFYRNMTVALLKEKLQGIGYLSKEVLIPFFKEEETLPDLPADLKHALEDAVVLQTRDEMGICAAGNEVLAKMNERLCSSIRENQDFVDSLTVVSVSARAQTAFYLTQCLTGHLSLHSHSDHIALSATEDIGRINDVDDERSCESNCIITKQFRN